MNAVEQNQAAGETQVAPQVTPHELVTRAKACKTVAEAREVIYDLADLKPAKPSFNGLTAKARRDALDELRAAQRAYGKIANPVLRALQESGLASDAQTSLRGRVLKSGALSIVETHRTTFAVQHKTVAV